MPNFDLIVLTLALIFSVSLTYFLATLYKSVATSRVKEKIWRIISLFFLTCLALYSIIYFKGTYIPNQAKSAPDLIVLDKRAGTAKLGKHGSRDAFYLVLSSDKWVLEVETSYYTYKNTQIGSKIPATTLHMTELHQLFKD